MERKKRFFRRNTLTGKCLEKKLDELERQYYENGKIIDIDTKFGKFSAPVVELDLRSQEEKEKQENEQRPPYFILGSVAQNYHQMAAFVSGLALNGERVLVPTWPEQAASRPDNFGELLKKQGDLEIHKEYAKKIIQALGLEKINLVGYSMGAPFLCNWLKMKIFPASRI